MSNPKIQAELAKLQAKSKHPNRVKLAQAKQVLFAINEPILNQLAEVQKRSLRGKAAGK